MRKIIERGLCLISCLFMLWLFISWAEVVSKNLKPNPTYSSWNAWVILTEVSHISEACTTKGKCPYEGCDGQCKLAPLSNQEEDQHGQ